MAARKAAFYTGPDVTDRVFPYDLGFTVYLRRGVAMEDMEGNVDDA